MNNRLIINADQGRELISRHIYGHFAEHLGRCIYEGIWVGEDSPIPNVRGIRQDVVAALRQLNIPNLRWPGGCFADEYHWQDGIGPKTSRPTMINTHWGGVTENNHFGTHEFFDLCEQLGCEPYICGNVGSGTVREMQQWVEYMTFDGVSPMAELRKKNGRAQPWRLKWFGVGNENWGCGGHMRPEYYADEYRRYATYVRDFGENKVFKIACGPNSVDYHWTDVLMREAQHQMGGLALHYYTKPGHNSKSATQFNEVDWLETLANAREMDELITRHVNLMDRHEPQRRVALIVDEWGTWFHVEPGTNPGFLYQQNTIRDALVAGVTFHIFHKHCARVRMANIAQTVNVLQAMILTDGARMLRTPSYHVFEMFKVHQDATLLPIQLDCATFSSGDRVLPLVSASASRANTGQTHLSLCNLHSSQSVELHCTLRGLTATKMTGRILTAPAITTHNTFEEPNTVVPTGFNDWKITATGLTVKLPARAVVVLEIGAAI